MDYEFETFSDDIDNIAIEKNDKFRNQLINTIFETDEGNSKSKNTKDYSGLQLSIVNILSKYGYNTSDRSVQMALASFLDNLSRL